jgi:hypothetical protein
MESSPYQLSDDLTLMFSEDDRLLLAEISTADVRTPVTATWLKDQIAQYGLDKLRLDQNAITQLLKQYNDGESEVILTIGERVNGEFTAKLSDDNMFAYLSCSPPQGGQAVSKQQVMDYLAKLGVIIGIREQAIDEALATGESHNVVIAEGEPATDGADGYFEKIIQDFRDRRPRIDDAGRAHYNDIVQFVTVKAGEPLIRRVLETEGKSGQTVLGAVIPPMPGESVMFAASLHGTKLASDDPNLLVADIAGQPVFVENGAIVEATITVEDVDKKTGNIEFDGSVMVNGNVTTGMRIDADGDVFINGMIEEASCVNAGGDIIVQHGVIGRGSITEDNGRPGPGISRLTSKGTIAARFIENTIVEAGHNVEVSELIAHSDVTAGNAVMVGKKGAKRGHIMGGVTRAEKFIKVEVLGSQACVHTEVIVGNNPQYISALKQTNQLLDSKASERKGLELALARSLKEQGNNNTEIQQKLQATLAQLTADINRLTALKVEQKAELQQLKEAQVIVKKKAFNAVDITVANFHERLSEEKNGGTYMIRDGALNFEFI